MEKIMIKLIRGIIFAVLSLIAVLCGFILFSIDKAIINPVHKQLDQYTSSGGTSGSFKKDGDLNIFNLHGSYDEMGQQYGALAYNQLNEIYQTLTPKYFAIFNYKTVLSYILRTYYNWRLDERERSILQGMAKTSGLTYRQLLSIEMLPTLITLYSGFDGDKLSDAGGLGHCSFLSVWGKRSKLDTTLVARNLDLSTPVTQLDNYHSLVIYNPTNANDNSVATFGFIGFIPGFTWVNSRGLFAEYNDGRRSVPGFNFFNGYIGLNTAFYGMFSANNSQEFTKFVENHPAFVSNFTAIADTNKTQSLEHAVNNPLSILDGQGSDYLFFTNIYRTEFKDAKLMLQNCVEKTKDTPSYACVRYHHLEKFIANNPQLDIVNLKDFFYTSLDDGGIYQTGSSKNYPVAEVTIHTVIGNLSTGDFIYSNHQNKDSWINIPLYSYFSK